MHKKEKITYHQKNGEILGGNSIDVFYRRACDSSVPADGREELQSNVNLQISL